MDWIKCSERMPELPCIIVDGNGNLPEVPKGITIFEDKNGKHLAFDSDLVFEYKDRYESGTFPLLCEQNAIKYWMPLPDPPKEATDNVD